MNVDNKSLYAAVGLHESNDAPTPLQVAHGLARSYQVLNLDHSILPLPEELHVAAWRTYAAESGQHGVYDVLCKKLPQFWFPVRAGIAASADYRAALYRGAVQTGLEEAVGLELEYPGDLRLVLHDSPVGAVPALLPRGRADFMNLFRALSCRHEPEVIPDSVGAAMIIGFNNWDRIHTYRQQWESTVPPGALWSEEFRRITACREYYQDRLLLISDGPYSAVPAEVMGMTEEDWRITSVRLRLEHECAHMLTYRLLKPTGKSVLDELIADFLAIVRVSGSFRPDWLLRFWGLETSPDYSCSRLVYYAPEAEEAELRQLTAWVKAIALEIQQLTIEHGTDWKGQLTVVNKLLSP